MAVDFDQFPLYDKITNEANKLTGVWQGSLATFMQTLIGYLSQNGIFVPQLTTTQRDDIQSPIEGQMIYNTTLLAPQIWQGGVWKTFTTV